MSEETKKPKDLTRRTFLKTTAGVAAAMGMTLGGISLATGEASAAMGDALPRKWDETYDVIVIGSGFAGLAAAIEGNLGFGKLFLLTSLIAFGILTQTFSYQIQALLDRAAPWGCRSVAHCAIPCAIPRPRNWAVLRVASSRVSPRAMPAI